MAPFSGFQSREQVRKCGFLTRLLILLATMHSRRLLRSLSARQLNDAGISLELASRGRAANVDAAIITNLEALR